ncbi:MAG: acyl carrier protein [Ferruginibacter sp.]
MELNNLLQDLTPVFRSELDDDNIVLTPETTADNVENWDSITNIQLIVAIEKKYKIRFTSKEIQQFKNVGELAESLRSKING